MLICTYGHTTDVNRLWPRRANTLEGSRRNIEEHYDAGNDMYRLFLEPTMTYSSGIHQPGKSPALSP